MNNYQSRKKTIIITAISITLGIIIIFIFLIYMNNSEEKNVNNFNTYLKENNYKKDENGIYSKTNTKDNITTTEKAISNKYPLVKNITENKDNYTSLTLLYTNDEIIEIKYQVEGYDQNEEYGVLVQQGTYKNGDFKCEIVTNKNFQTNCKYMKTEAQKYEKEINEIIKKYDINLKNIKIKN